MAKYRKRPLVVEAEQLNWRNWNAVADLVTDILNETNQAVAVSGFNDTCGEPGPEYIELAIPTPEGVMIARHGDWIIRGVTGEFYPCRADIFEATYEPAEPTSEPGDEEYHEDG